MMMGGWVCDVKTQVTNVKDDSGVGIQFKAILSTLILANLR